MPQNIDKYWSTVYKTGSDFNLASTSLITGLLSFTDPTLPKTCLDIGCGTGQLSRELFHRGYVVTGVDASYEAIQRAQASTVVPKERLSYLHLDFERNRKGLPDKTYSLVTCKLVYAFVKNKAQFLKRVASLLSQKGTLIIITPLLTNVLPEKRGIAVDYDQTLVELRAVFRSVETYEDNGLCVFVCKAS